MAIHVLGNKTYPLSNDPHKVLPPFPIFLPADTLWSTTDYQGVSVLSNSFVNFGYRMSVSSSGRIAFLVVRCLVGCLLNLSVMPGDV